MQRLTLLVAGMNAAVLFQCGGGDPPAGPDAAVVDAGVPDAPSTPPGPCDPLAQDGCGAGEKCSVVPSPDGLAPPTVGCVDGAGSSLGSLDDCSPATWDVPDDCSPGLICVGEDSPRCMEICSPYPDSCTAGSVCALAVEVDVGGLPAEVYLCAELCDPLAQDCARGSDACYPSLAGTTCAPEGAGSLPAGEGDACDYANSCERGLGCFRIGTAIDYACVRLCDPTGGEPSCTGGQLCNQVDDETWGVCIAG